MKEILNLKQYIEQLVKHKQMSKRIASIILKRAERIYQEGKEDGRVEYWKSIVN